ncbi:MAG: L-rhamnose catabolism isomerase [Deltaproteobacteria bacterium]|nr:L-rhamnose catabolism isomerase [Deltaproteobacteria bacterium]
MAAPFEISDSFIADQNKKLESELNADFAHLGSQLARRNIDIEKIVGEAQAFGVALPSWGVGTGGTRFARFPGVGEPRNVDEKLADCGVVQKLSRNTPTVSLHIPWDKPKDIKAMKEQAAALGLGFDAMNSNTFQDQADQKLSYKFGSLTHPDPAVRAQAVAHNIECIELGAALGSKALTVWIGDGGNFPGQHNFRKSLERYLESTAQIYKALPADWRVFLEHKLFEPSFYSTVINDWGTSFMCAEKLGPKAACLVDLGHHAPNVNIEMIVARLIQAGKLAGFHFNDSKYGDDDLDSGSIKPFQLFLVFNELVDAAQSKVPNFNPAYMIDQSHNVTDPIESLLSSTNEIVRAYTQALLVDRVALAEAQDKCDAIGALATLKKAFNTDVTPILGMSRKRSGGAVDPVATYRASGYRQHKAEERPSSGRGGSGIV